MCTNVLRNGGRFHGFHSFLVIHVIKDSLYIFGWDIGFAYNKVKFFCINS